MKIGIITFHMSYNCGSILQCMALKNVLESLGAEVDILNFSNVNQQKLYSVYYKKLTVKNIVKNILCIPGQKDIENHYNQYKDYIYDVFELKGKPYSSSEELNEYIPKYDMLIAGGDQVWNVNCDDFDTAYFLDFNDDTYKISYSPSLGATNINLSPDKEKYKGLLEKFNDISCREINGKKWLEELTGRNVELMPDPTLLLNASEWMEKAKPLKTNLNKKEYIFYYAFSYSKENNEAIEKFAEENDLDVIVIDAKQWCIKNLRRYKRFILLDETGPNAFLNLMNGAKYIITTSFHGTVFSLIYKKKFIYINGKKHQSTDDRTSFLLERLNLMNHYICAEDVGIEKLELKIDYDVITKQISELKQNAYNYLKRSMKNAMK